MAGVINGGAGRRQSWRQMPAMALFLAVVMATAGCQSTDGGTGDESADDTDSSAAAVDEPGVTSTTTDVQSTTTEVVTEVDEPTEESSSATFKTVRIDTGEVGEFIDQQLVDEKVAEATLVAGDNWFHCVMDPENCDFDRDVSPSMSGNFEQILRSGLPETYLEPGARYRMGPIDIRTVVEVVASNQIPVIAQVTLCQVDTGEVYIPAKDGRSEEILNDDVSGVLITYVVIQNEDGVLTVNDRLVGEGTSDETFCDEYL